MLKHCVVVGLTLLCSAPTGSAQARWRLRPQVGFGAYVPLTSLGTIGTASGHMNPAAVMGLAAGVHSADFPLGVRLSGVLALANGTDFTPTELCQIGCTRYTNPYPQFAGVALDAAVRLGRGRTTIGLFSGPGLRGYRSPDLVCACDPLRPGELAPFGVEELHLAGHFGAEIAHRVGGGEIAVQVEDYVGVFRNTRVRQHDLLIMLVGRLR